jgi:hypothetical protein
MRDSLTDGVVEEKGAGGLVVAAINVEDREGVDGNRQVVSVDDVAAGLNLTDRRNRRCLRWPCRTSSAGNRSVWPTAMSET